MAGHSASIRAFTPVFDWLWTRVNAYVCPGMTVERSIDWNSSKPSKRAALLVVDGVRRALARRLGGGRGGLARDADQVARRDAVGWHLDHAILGRQAGRDLDLLAEVARDRDLLEHHVV